MTFTHDDIQARLIEFLYGELGGEARAAFDAHVAACEACRREVNEFAQTRATARAVVRAPLDEPVPSAVRARVMEAAARASAERAAAARVPAVTGGSTAPGGGTSRWLAWLRARWTLPVLTTAAAMGALLLFRETLFREARRPLSDTAIEELRPRPAPAPTAEEGKPAVPAEAAATEPERPRALRGPVAESPPTDKVRSESKGERSKGVKAGKRTMQPVKAKSDSDGFGAGDLGRAENKARVDELLSKMRSEKSADSVAAKDVSRRDMDSALEGLSAGSGRRSSAPQAEESRARKMSVADDLEAEGDQGRGTGFAQPPPPSAPAARKPAVAALPTAAPTPRAPAPSAGLERVASEAAAGPSANARASEPAAAEDAPAGAPREKSEKKKKAPAKMEDPSSAPAAAGTKLGGAARPVADPAAVLVERAEKLMTARRFAEAATVYKDLLHRFPRHAAVPTWRRRLAAAQTAAQGQNQSGESGFATPPPPR